MKLTRRASLTALAAAFALPSAAHATSILEIAELGTALANAADAIGKLAANIKIAVQQGMIIWDLSTSRLMRERMLTLSRNLTLLAAGQKAVLAEALRDYLANWTRMTANGHALTTAEKQALASDWSLVAAGTTEVLSQVKAFLDELTRERSTFIATGAYRDLASVLSARVSLLSRLQSIDPPTTPAEIARLRQVDDSYATLRRNLATAIDSLNDYIRTL